MFLGDFHLHSTYSDGVLSIPELVDLMGQSGMGAIAITDHLCEEKSFLGKAAHFLSKTLTRATFPEYLETIRREAERAWRQYRMVVIPGVEITKNSFSHNHSAHILALDIHKFIHPDPSIHEIVNSIHAQGAVAVAAHPVYTGRSEHQTRQLWNLRDELGADIIWEVASGRQRFHEVEKSGFRRLANSDLHVPKQLESWKTAFDVERSREAIIDAIVRQKIDFRYFQGRPSRERQFLRPALTPA